MNKFCLDIYRFKKKQPVAFFLVTSYLSFLIIYLIIYMFYMILFVENKTIMPLNELGDFLSGSFAPLAFLFLYLGYKQNSKSLEIQAKELKASNDALQNQVFEMKKTVETQQNMFELAEKQYKDSINEKLKNNMPELSFVGSKYMYINKFGSEAEHRFDIDIKANNKSIKNLKIQSNFWYLTKSGGSYDLSNVIEINSIELNKSVKLMLYISTNIVPFQKNILNFDYYGEDGTKFSKKYELNKNDDQVVTFKEIPSDI